MKTHLIAVSALAGGVLLAQVPPPRSFAPAATSIVIGTQGCPMAHCDCRLSDIDSAALPADPSSVQIISQDLTGPDGSAGLGCSSNYTVVACTYSNVNGANLVVYTADGVPIFDSGTLLDSWAWTSAPIVDAYGNVIAADDKSLIEFTPSGAVAWQTPTPGGNPISPVLTSNGVIVLATNGGPISAYSAATGALLGSVTVRGGGGLVYDTRNTAAVNGNRIYVVMSAVSQPSVGRLYAFDVYPSTSTPLVPRWWFSFGGPSGGSPLVINNVVYFDAAQQYPGATTGPYLFAIQDLGATYSVLFQRPAPGRVIASAAQDPRGGFWTYASTIQYLYRLDALTGELVQQLNVNALTNPSAGYAPTSALSIVNTPDGGLVMLVGAAAFGNTSAPSYVEALDLVQSQLLWKVAISPNASANWIASQFVVALNAAGAPRIAFTGRRSRAFFVGNP